MFGREKKLSMPSASEALPGRENAMPLSNKHFVNGHPIQPPFPDNMHTAMFGMGCFWGAERKFWVIDGVYTTSVGYAGGYTPNPTYQEVCSGMTGHNEVVHVVYDPDKVNYTDLLKVFWESHDPTQGMRQGNDVGTQYRSVIFYHNDKQKQLAETYKKKLDEAGIYKDPIVTEIVPYDTMYVAENYHQNYFNENGSQPYCSFVIQPKVEKFKKVFKDKLKK